MRIAPRRSRSARRTLKRAVWRAHKLAPVPGAGVRLRLSRLRPRGRLPSAPLRLSSNTASPLEPLISPLTFELKRLGVFHPCWSCEGHNDGAGRRKLPRVWFYADSVVHIRALGEALDRLFMEKRVWARWRVVLTYSDADNPDTTFSLELKPSGDRQPLSDLQADARAIDRGLERLDSGDRDRRVRSRGAGQGAALGGMDQSYRRRLRVRLALGARLLRQSRRAVECADRRRAGIRAVDLGPQHPAGDDGTPALGADAGRCSRAFAWSGRLAPGRDDALEHQHQQHRDQADAAPSSAPSRRSTKGGCSPASAPTAPRINALNTMPTASSSTSGTKSAMSGVSSWRARGRRRRWA